MVGIAWSKFSFHLVDRLVGILVVGTLVRGTAVGALDLTMCLRSVPMLPETLSPSLVIRFPLTVSAVIRSSMMTVTVTAYANPLKKLEALCMFTIRPDVLKPVVTLSPGPRINIVRTTNMSVTSTRVT